MKLFGAKVLSVDKVEGPGTKYSANRVELVGIYTRVTDIKNGTKRSTLV